MIESILSEECLIIKLTSIGSSNEIVKYEYQITLKKGSDRYSIFNKLNAIENITNVRINNRASVDRV